MAVTARNTKSKINWADKLARYVELKEQIKQAEDEMKQLGTEIKIAVENGTEVKCAGYCANVHDSVRYEWDPVKFRNMCPGLWIECSAVDTKKANAFMAAGRITPEKAEAIRTPSVSKVLTVKECKPR